MEFMITKQEKTFEINGFQRFSLVAEVGFEPHGLRVMSPTSYQTAPLRDIWCRKPVSNRYDTLVSRDFKSRASANSAIPANGASVTLFFPIA